MAEWRAELQNYHIKPGFLRTLGGTGIVATDSEKKKKKASIMKIKVLKPSLTTTVSFEIMFFFFFGEAGYVRAAGLFHLPHYICPHTGPDVNYAWSSKANFPNV